MKVCFRCKIEKCDSEFSKCTQNKDGLYSWCKLCANKYTKTMDSNNKEKRKERCLVWRKNNPEKVRNKELKRLYNMSLEEYHNLLILQNNVCAICGKPETKVIKGKVIRLSVDHNHTTGKVRGLLCIRCNSTIGYINDNIMLCDEIKSYLLKYKEEKCPKL